MSLQVASPGPLGKSSAWPGVRGGAVWRRVDEQIASGAAQGAPSGQQSRERAIFRKRKVYFGHWCFHFGTFPAAAAGAGLAG